LGGRIPRCESGCEVALLLAKSRPLSGSVGGSVKGGPAPLALGGVQ